ncbi:unnamed protein product [Ranitomeya imitator]|uniref:Uncharacterized protein n=1 Tax=Ranitomeya imitator TaxID=111125 RepID=A0ABN9KSH8_9NEOB|nr:unnamed protein product [Ranitomeya imitator]
MKSLDKAFKSRNISLAMNSFVQLDLPVSNSISALHLMLRHLGKCITVGYHYTLMIIPAFPVNLVIFSAPVQPERGNSWYRPMMELAVETGHIREFVSTANQSLEFFSPLKRHAKTNDVVQKFNSSRKK